CTAYTTLESISAQARSIVDPVHRRQVRSKLFPSTALFRSPGQHRELYFSPSLELRGRARRRIHPHEESGRLGARLHQLHVSADEERQLRLLGVLSELLRYAEQPAFFDGLPVECADCPAVCPPELDLHDAARVRPRCWRSPSAGRLAGELPRRVAVRPEVDVVRWRRWN